MLNDEDCIVLSIEQSGQVGEPSSTGFVRPSPIRVPEGHRRTITFRIPIDGGQPPYQIHWYQHGATATLRQSFISYGQGLAGISVPEASLELSGFHYLEICDSARPTRSCTIEFEILVDLDDSLDLPTWKRWYLFFANGITPPSTAQEVPRLAMTMIDNFQAISFFEANVVVLLPEFFQLDEGGYFIVHDSYHSATRDHRSTTLWPISKREALFELIRSRHLIFYGLFDLVKPDILVVFAKIAFDLDLSNLATHQERVQAVEQHFLDMTEDDKRAAMSETLQVPSGFAEESDSVPESSSTTSPEPPPPTTPTSVGVRFQKSYFRFYKDLAIAPTRPGTPHHHGQGETQALKLVQQDGTMMAAGASSASRSLALASGVGLAAGVVIEGGVLAVDRFYRHKEITWKEAGQRLGVAVVVSTGASMSIAGSRIGLQSLSSAIGPVGATAGLALRHFNIVASLGLLGASAVYEVVRWRSDPHANLSELVRNLGGVGASHSGGFAGAAAGASIGLALLGPIGALAGAIAGGIAGAVTGTAVYTATMRRFDKSFEHCADRAARR